jgi:hypothetical protein
MQTNARKSIRVLGRIGKSAVLGALMLSAAGCYYDPYPQAAPNPYYAAPAPAPAVSGCCYSYYDYPSPYYYYRSGGAVTFDIDSEHDGHRQGQGSLPGYGHDYYPDAGRDHDYDRDHDHWDHGDDGSSGAVTRAGWG